MLITNCTIKQRYITVRLASFYSIYMLFCSLLLQSCAGHFFMEMCKQMQCNAEYYHLGTCVVLAKNTFLAHKRTAQVSV